MTTDSYPDRLLLNDRELVRSSQWRLHAAAFYDHLGRTEDSGQVNSVIEATATS